MKKKKSNKKLWKGVPDELRFMCLADIHSVGQHYCIEPILKYVIDHMHDCNSTISGTTPFDVIRWVDIVFESCMFPLEFHEASWRSFISELSQILNRSEELLRRVGPSDYNTGFRTVDDGSRPAKIIELAQKLDVYFCVLYMYTEDWSSLQKRLEMLRADTQRNVQHLLSSIDAMRFAMQDDWAEYHYPGVDSWEPLNWLMREYIPGGKARKLLAQVFERYVLFLNEQSRSINSTEASILLRRKSEERFRELCNMVLEEIEACQEDTSIDKDDLLLGMEKILYEDMYQRSLDRFPEEEICETSTATEQMSYHGKYGAFTKKLQTLMKDYPTLPVVVLQNGKGKNGAACSIAYVHDTTTGEFREKIIAVYALPNRASETIEDNNDLPF